MAPRSALLSLTLATACSVEPAADKAVEEPAPDSGFVDGPPAWCDGSTAHRWDPSATEDPDLFPDGMLEDPDEESPTGRRLHLTAERSPWLAEAPTLLREGFEALDGLSGFGTNGGVLLRFAGPVTDVPSGAEATLASAGWMLVAFGEDGPTRVPFSAELLEDGHTVVAWPLVPLKLATRHAFVVTTAANAADGDCIAPAPTTQALLYGDPPQNAPSDAAERYRLTAAELGLDAGEISAMTVFTTHDETGTFRDLAASIRDQPVAWLGEPDCIDRSTTRQCDATISVLDYRNERGLIDPSVTPVEGEIPVRIWTPLEGDGPWPVIVYGHGLGSSRGEARYVAEAGTGEGYAVVAMEAVLHGDHPSSTSGDTRDAALAFLGLDLVALKMDPLALRGNFDQTNLDRVRLMELLRQDGDFDGDGLSELDGDRMGYLGISLGAILGPQLLAVSPEVQGAVLSVGGGRLLSIVTDTESLSTFEDVLGALVGSNERFDRLVPLAQHVVDPADAALWGAHLLRDRFDDGPPPNLLMQVGLFDEVVPKSAGHALARAIGMPHMAPVAEPVDTLTVVEEDPLVGNLEDGRTAAFFQVDRVTSSRGRVTEATHVATPTSPEGTLQMLHFLESWLETGEAEAIDPYAALDTPAL